MRLREPGEIERAASARSTKHPHRQDLLLRRVGDGVSGLPIWIRARPVTASLEVRTRITETNARDDRHRKNWYLWLSQWMVASNGLRMLTYWNPSGLLSGPWPPSQTVIDYWNQVLEPTYGRP